jgi:toxin ParE1/3/4
MKWRVEFRPEVQEDLARAAKWYEDRAQGLGSEFIEEVIRVWDDLAENPLRNSRRHPVKNVRWRYPERFPYRVIYEVIESERLVVVAALLHAAQADWRWKNRIK